MRRQKPAPIARDSSGNTLLWRVAEGMCSGSRHKEGLRMMKKLVELGLDPLEEPRDSYGRTLLMTGVKSHLPLFTRYVKSIDVDHTVHLYELMPRVRKLFSKKELASLETYLREQGFEE